MCGQNDVLSWLHIGDLHLTKAGEQNHRDLQGIVNLTQGLPSGSLDFAVLPGDNADDGTAAQFALLRAAVTRLPMPLYILPGDHDFKPTSLDAFYTELHAEQLPRSVTFRRNRCLFLDVVSAGTGGPDFRLDTTQLIWLEQEIDHAEAARQAVVVFMHTYPADLREGAIPLLELLRRPQVVCVDMGHTHYNELTNDGRTIYMTTRSTGQVEEGPVGFSVAAIDEGGVSWRFKPMDDAWPCVLITHPIDWRLVRHAVETTPSAASIRAKVFGDAPMQLVEVRIDDGEWMAMSPVPGGPALWEAPMMAGQRVSVRAHDSAGRTDLDLVELPGPGWMPPFRYADGSDADRVGAWPERHLFDTQLGPNRNGRQW